jgi:hypothetical protein
MKENIFGASTDSTNVNDGLEDFNGTICQNMRVFKNE